MLNIIITSYGEPKATQHAIDSFLEQEMPNEFQLAVIDPFAETKKIIESKYKSKVDFFLDPGEGKSYALNIYLEKIFSKNPNDLIILTDGDVYVSKNSVQKILSAFQDEKVGCVTCRPVSLNERQNKFGYWSKLLFDGIHNVRKQLSDSGSFFECSGYLFAIRNSILQGFPLGASEDSIIPYLFWKQGYKIKYVPEAEVYVLNPQNWKDYKTQKIRNIKGHENLTKIAKEMPRTKSFFNEIKEGLLFSLMYPKKSKEFLWTLELIFSRLYIYLLTFYDLKFRKKEYQDGWRKDSTDSTKPMD